MEIFDELRQGKKNHNVVFQIMQDRLDEIIENNNNVTIFYDATNLSRKFRIPLYNRYKNKTRVTIVFISKPLEVIKEQNKQRYTFKRVPECTVEDMYKRIEVPRLGVDCDKIEVIGNYEDFEKEIEKNIHKPHSSPYHKERIDEHINMVIDNAKKTNNNKLVEVAKFHDLGKSVCRVPAEITSNAKRFFIEKRGEFYQYMQHQNVSAMYYLINVGNEINKNKDFQDILEIIARHNDAHAGISKKKIRRYNLRDELIELIYRFEEIDTTSKVADELLEEYLAIQSK